MHDGEEDHGECRDMKITKAKKAKRPKTLLRQSNSFLITVAGAVFLGAASVLFLLERCVSIFHPQPSNTVESLHRIRSW